MKVQLKHGPLRQSCWRLINGTVIVLCSMGPGDISDMVVACHYFFWVPLGSAGKHLKQTLSVTWHLQSD